MKLILLRHGLRESGFGDISLSTQGQAQATALSQVSAFKDAQILLCSPKKRALETITPTAQALGLKVKIEPHLDQQTSMESQQEFLSRASLFMNHLASEYSGQSLIACSHSDWLQAAILSLDGHITDPVTHCLLSCAEYKTFQYKNNTWSLL